MVEVEALCRGGVASTLAAVAANQRDVEASVRGLLGDAESLQSVIAHFAGDLRALVSTSAVRAWLSRLLLRAVNVTPALLSGATGHGVLGTECGACAGPHQT
jgi:hypothetical protein